jgi:hypothetical protein
MSGGPKVKIIPSACLGREFKDLSDLLGFDTKGEVGEVYGLELDATGLYRQKVIDNTADDAEKKVS